MYVLSTSTCISTTARSGYVMYFISTSTCISTTARSGYILYIYQYLYINYCKIRLCNVLYIYQYLYINYCKIRLSIVYLPVPVYQLLQDQVMYCISTSTCISTTARTGYVLYIYQYLYINYCKNRSMIWLFKLSSTIVMKVSRNPFISNSCTMGRTLNS